MRLLHTKTKKLKEFLGASIPPYAILSHTWGNNEVTFNDVYPSGYISGSAKIDGCINQAINDGWDYIWVDTCCIDKSSSAELSEAINSMWAWYGAAEVCYAYLSDVHQGDAIEDEHSYFRKSRWFTRGWTLQELISPRMVCFYNSTWKSIGSTSGIFRVNSFLGLISRITLIPSELLLDRLSGMRTVPGDYSMAQKMSWAAGRTSTRVEDEAYSLLGLFGVNMSMLYGEGRNAFTRLQMKIIKSSDDESILAWGFYKPSAGVHKPEYYKIASTKEPCALLATSPAAFSADIVPFTPAGVQTSHYSMTNKGLQISMYTEDLFIGGGASIGRLNCSGFGNEGSKSIAVPLIRSSYHRNVYSRAKACPAVLVQSTLFSGSSGPPIYIHKTNAGEELTYDCGFRINWSLDGEIKPTISEFYPPNWGPILSHGWMLNQQPNLEKGRQSIYFACHCEDGVGFLVKLEYFFVLKERALVFQNLDFSAAVFKEGQSLAELLMIHRTSIEGEMRWKERLFLEDAVISFRLEKPKPLRQGAKSGTFPDTQYILYIYKRNGVEATRVVRADN